MSARLLTLGEGAKYLGIGRQHLSAAVAKGAIEVVRLPGTKFPKLTIEALEAFIKSHTSGPISGPITEIETPQVEETLDPSTQGQRSKKGGDVHWMERYKRK